MTPQEIDAMEAGRELDRLVAEKVMGWSSMFWREAGTDGTYTWPGGWYGAGPNHEAYLSKSYSTDIEAAWEVFMHFPDTHKGIYHTQRKSLGWTLGQPMIWKCTIGATNTVEADTAPLAICRAALKAVLSD